MNKKNHPGIIVGGIALIVVFAWAPIVPCEYSGPPEPGSTETITAGMVCPINPFLVRRAPEESYLYFGILDRNSLFGVGVLYLGNILVAYGLSYLLLGILPAKLRKKPKAPIEEGPPQQE